MRISKIDHVVMTTDVVDECLKFYRMLGFSIRDAQGRYELTAGDVRINLYRRGDGVYPHADNMQPGSTDLCFELDGNIDDLRMLRDYFEKQGLDVSGSLVPRNGLRGAMQSFYLRDPDGNSIEISSYGG